MALRMLVTSLIGVTPRLDHAGDVLALLREQVREPSPSVRAEPGELPGSGSVHRRQPLSIPPAWSQILPFFETPLVIEPSPGQRSGDAGLRPVNPSGRRSGLTRAFADALVGPCNPERTGPPSWGWSAPASTASRPAMLARTAMIPSDPIPSSST